MEKEIAKIIEEQLPAQVGSVLKARLEKADADAAEVRSMNVRLENQGSLLAEYREKVATLQNRLKGHRELDIREAEVFAREKEQDLRLLREQLDCSNRSKADLFNLVSLIFRNTTVREALCSTTNSPTGYSSATETKVRSVEDQP